LIQEEHLDYLEGKIAITEPERPTENLPSEGIALVDFYAERCEPCKNMEPFIDDLKEEFKDKEVEFVKVDV
jgi:thiol-disulfide isomerase/thioredoxin